MTKRPLIHIHIEQQLSHYADLTADEKQVVDAHLATCARCRRFWQQQLVVDDTLRELHAPLDQDQLRRGFQQGLAQRRQPPKTAFFSQGWATATAVLLLAFVVIGFWFIMRTTTVNPAASGEPQPTATPTVQPTPTPVPTPTAVAWGQLADYFQYETPVTAVALSPDGEWVAAGNQRGVVTIWQTETGRRAHNFVAVDSSILAMATNGQALAFVSEAGVLQVWELETQTIVWETAVATDGLTNLALGENDFVAIVVDESDVVLHNGTEETVLSYTNDASAVAFGENGRFLYVATQTGGIQQWDIDANYRQETWDVVNGTITAVATIEDQISLLLEGNQTTVWSLTTESIIVEQTAPIVGESIALSASGPRIALGTERGAIELWGQP
ncbi:MAG: zf-HC2 domain-containing protein [Chloroflexota bacterium]